MEIKKNTKVKVQYRPELGTGTVLQVAEAHGGEYHIDVVFEKDGKRFLETFPKNLLTPVADIFQRYQNNESDHPTDFFLKQLAWQLPLENSGGELSNSKTDLLPHQILLTHQIINARTGCSGVATCLTARYLFTIEFDDGTRRELYQSLLIDGQTELGDFDFLYRNDFKGKGVPMPLSIIEDKLRMFTMSREAKIRSDYDAVINIRHKCIGIQLIST